MFLYLFNFGISWSPYKLAKNAFNAHRIIKLSIESIHAISSKWRNLKKASCLDVLHYKIVFQIFDCKSFMRVFCITNQWRFYRMQLHFFLILFEIFQFQILLFLGVDDLIIFNYYRLALSSLHLQFVSEPRNLKVFKKFQEK